MNDFRVFYAARIDTYGPTCVQNAYNNEKGKTRIIVRFNFKYGLIYKYSLEFKKTYF